MCTLKFKTIFHYMYGVFLFILLMLARALSSLIFRPIAHFLLKILYGSKYQICPNPIDVFLGMEETESSHPIPVLKIRSKHPPNLQKITEIIQNKVLLFKSNLRSNGQQSSKQYLPFKVLRQCYVRKFLFFCWRTDPDFQIKNHIFLDHFDPNESYNEKEFGSLLDSKIAHSCAYYAQVKFPPSRPQWQIRILAPKLKETTYIINQEKDEKKKTFNEIEYAFLMPINHAYMDAISFFQMLRHCLADTSFKMTVDPLATPRRNGAPWNLVDYIRMSQYILLMPHIFAKYVVEKYAELQNPNALFSQAPKTTRTCRWTHVNLKKLKEIQVRIENPNENAIGESLSDIEKRPARARLNAVIISSISTAFTSIFESMKRTPEKIKLVIVTALLPYRSLHSTNNFTLGSISVPLGGHGQNECEFQNELKSNSKMKSKSFPRISTEDNNANANLFLQKSLRLFEMERIIDAGTNKYQLELSKIFFSTLGSLIYPWLCTFMAANLMSRFCLLSNIIGTEEKFTVFNGDNVEEIIIFSPSMGSLYSSIATCNYNGSLCIAMMSDQSLVDKFPGLPSKCLALISKELESLSHNPTNGVTVAIAECKKEKN